MQIEAREAAVRMVAIDMDGTLLGPDGQVSAENLRAVRAATEAGVEVVIATGRRHCYAMRVLRGLELPAEGVLISSNGTVTRTIGNGSALIERTLLPRETALWLCDHLGGHRGEFRNAMVLTFDRVQPDGNDAVGALVVEELADLHASIGRWMIANEPYIRNIRPIEQALESESPIQMMLCGSVERMRRAEALLLAEPGVFVLGVSPAEEQASARVTLSRTEYPKRDLSLLDILPAGCSKGAALLRLAESRGIAAADTMAIGDNWNDLSMLEVAGRPVLMENAPEDLRELARSKGWEMTARNDQDGVAKTLNAMMAMLATRLQGRPADAPAGAAVLA